MKSATERVTPRGVETRKRILDCAVDVASAEGLEGLTIGRLATELGMSKAGLFGHFGSKEELQMATVEAAREIFIAQVVTPVLAATPGLPRLLVLCDAWLAYSHGDAFRGGCFFAAAAAEFDGRPGPVRDRIAETMREWLAGLERAIDESREHGHLQPKLDAAQIAWELNALELGANWSRQLFGDDQARGRARAAITERVMSLATPAGKRAVSRMHRN
jgi:AcrR family transcriptional regulator